MSLSIFDLVIRITLVVATGILFTLVLTTYLRLKNRKLLFLSIGFGIFFAHATVYLPELFGPIYTIDENTHLIIHLSALVSIVLGMFKD